MNAPWVRVADHYRNVLAEGLSRRSTAQFRVCPIRCRGCIVPDGWETDEERAFDQRVADVFVIAAVSPEAKAAPRGFERAVMVPRSSSPTRSELVHCTL